MFDLLKYEWNVHKDMYVLGVYEYIMLPEKVTKITSNRMMP